MVTNLIQTESPGVIVTAFGETVIFLAIIGCPPQSVLEGVPRSMRTVGGWKSPQAATMSSARHRKEWAKVMGRPCRARVLTPIRHMT